MSFSIPRCHTATVQWPRSRYKHWCNYLNSSRVIIQYLPCLLLTSFFWLRITCYLYLSNLHRKVSVSDHYVLGLLLSQTPHISFHPNNLVNLASVMVNWQSEWDSEKFINLTEVTLYTSVWIRSVLLRRPNSSLHGSAELGSRSPPATPSCHVLLLSQVATCHYIPEHAVSW